MHTHIGPCLWCLTLKCLLKDFGYLGICSSIVNVNTRPWGRWGHHMHLDHEMGKNAACAFKDHRMTRWWTMSSFTLAQWCKENLVLWCPNQTPEWKLHHHTCWCDDQRRRLTLCMLAQCPNNSLLSHMLVQQLWGATRRGGNNGSLCLTLFSWRGCPTTAYADTTARTSARAPFYLLLPTSHGCGCRWGEVMHH